MEKHLKTPKERTAFKKQYSNGEMHTDVLSNFLYNRTDVQAVKEFEDFWRQDGVIALQMLCNIST